ncbi:MAG: hypothetical protein LQ343_004880 [Gyalolechia ehrenbergii]|nr:MAG: hypothetical protein LQ343_004880 [Gyalolechia ehrenbergii]
MASVDFLKILVVTFNCGRQLLKPAIFAQQLTNELSGSQRPEILVLSLQEIAPIAHSFLGGSCLVRYFLRFFLAVKAATKAIEYGNYVPLITRNVGMTGCIIFVLEEHKSKIRWIESAGVGVGVQGMANKGAVGIRLGYAVSEETLELTFVAAHLAPMEDALDRRNEDWMNIVRGLVFTSTNSKNRPTAAKQTATSDESEALLANSPEDVDQRPRGIYTPTSHLIFAGDLNYRTSITGPRPSDHLAFPKPTTEPTDPHHYSHLLRNDQLTRELKADRTCHGLQEAPIDFPPSYKYSNKAQLLAEIDDANAKWDWAKHRWPSWCDRILYLDLPSWMKAEMPRAKIEIEKYTALPLTPSSDHRPVLLAMRVPLKAIPTPEEGQGARDLRIRPPFEIDPLWREKRKVARRKEIFVGLLAYLFLTWEGNGILLALAVGMLVGWIILRSMLEV